MSGDTLLIHLAMIAAALALVSSVRGARHGVPMMRPLAGATAVLAGVYAVAYVVLLLVWGTTSVVWSQVMRGISVVSWLVVWCGWPRASVRAWRAAHRRLERIGGSDVRSE